MTFYFFPKIDVDIDIDDIDRGIDYDFQLFY